MRDSTNTQPFDLWKEANDEATAAELRVQHAALAFASGRGSPPSDEDLKAAWEARVRALALFEQMLSSFRAFMSTQCVHGQDIINAADDHQRGAR